MALANNKAQGIAMVGVLGMLIAGLPCLPVVDRFGPEPRHRVVAAKTPGGLTRSAAWPTNLAIAWPPFHRFVDKNT
ncbi:hypothetical protein H7J87_00330 [Mycolicibacterium wolinskyi]|nr:hypothetical protein [Mycolicibacterium wolinskyi]MCV7297212.1 hypothetical protein [Mycolicibacterium goodii]